MTQLQPPPGSESEQDARLFLSSIINTIADPIFVKDEEHRWIILNDAFCAFMGHAREELIAKSDYEFFPKEQADVFWQKDAEVFRTGKENINEEQFTDAKGVEHTIVTKKSIFTDGRGKKVLVGIIRDITDRKNIEHELARHQQQLRLLLDSAGEAIYGIDLQGNCTFCNAAFLKIMGYEREADLLGKNMHKMIHHSHADGSPFDAEQCRIFRAFRVGEGSHADDEVLWKADGTNFPAEYWSYPQRRDGEVVGAVVTFIDITNRKNMEQALEAEHAKFKTLYESSSDAIMLLTPESGFFSGNPAAIKLFGCKDEHEFCSLSPDRLSPERQPDGSLSQQKSQEMMRIALDKGSHFFEWTHRRVDGTEFPATVLLTRIELEGKPVLQATVRDISEEKRRNEELRRLAAIVSSSSEAIIGKTIDGTIVNWNIGAERIYGYSAQEAVGRNIDFLAPDDASRAEIHSLLQRVRTGVELEQFEAVRKRKDGSQIIVSLSLSPIINEQGTVVGISTIAHDITAKKQAEEEARKSQEEQHIILDSVRAAIFYKDKENRFIRVNKELCRQMGKSKEELEGISVFDLFPREHAEAYWKDDKEVIESGQPKLGIIEQANFPSGLRWMQTDKIPYRDPEGNILGVIGFATDITDLLSARKKLEEEAANTRKFMQAVESSSIATIITSPVPEILYVNPAWERLTGFSRADAIGKNPRILQSGRTPKEMYPRMWNLILRGEEFITNEIINKRKDGTEFNAELRVYPIMENGSVRYFIGMQTDITLRKRSDQAKTEFMSLASHQLRSPLTGLRWGLAMVQKQGPLSPEQETLIHELQQQTTRMAESINVMLKISRIEAGRVEVHFAPVNLAEICKSLCEEFHPQVEMHHHRCSIACDDTIALQTDPSLLREILVNLITNAIKYSPDGSEIEMKTARLEHSVQITLRDNGYGIPLDQQSKMFSKFFRATNVASRIPDGTGLGLYLVSSLVGLLHGTISFVSAENKGTTFTLILPLTPPTHG